MSAEHDAAGRRDYTRRVVDSSTVGNQLTGDEDAQELKIAQEHYTTIISRIGTRWKEDQHTQSGFVNQETFDLKDIERVLCHIHKSSSSCKIGLNRKTGDIYHIVDTRQIYKYGARFNVRTESKEFWEKFNKNYIAPIMDSDRKTDFSYYVKLLDIFSQLDVLDITIMKDSKPQDFLKKHIITDGMGNLHLCNRHLMKRCIKIENADHASNIQVYTDDAFVKRRRIIDKEPQLKYMHPTFRKLVLHILFPSLSELKSSTTTTQIPLWVYAECDFLNYSINLRRQQIISNRAFRQQQQQQQQQQRSKEV